MTETLRDGLQWFFLDWNPSREGREQNKEAILLIAHALCQEAKTFVPINWRPSNYPCLLTTRGIELNIQAHVKPKPDLEAFVTLSGRSSGQATPVWVANFHCFGYGHECRYAVEGLEAYDDVLLESLDAAIDFLNKRISRDVLFLDHLQKF